MDSLFINNPPKYAEYVDCMVAFIDILGFDSRARNIKSEDDFNNVSMLLCALKDTERSFNSEQTFFRNLTITAVSDSAILTMPYHDEGCAMKLITVLHKIQYDLLATSFETLLRGYVTRGHVYHKDNIIFGKGYSDAYKKEKEIGHAPRIVIDPMLIEDAKSKISRCSNLDKMDHILNYIIADSSDGLSFIDYLKPVGIRNGIPKEQYISERAKILKFIEKNIITYKADEKILEKYRWLQQYASWAGDYLK